MTKKFATMPVVDLKGLTPDQQEKSTAGSPREAVAAQLRTALEEYGTFYVINHGVPLTTVKSLHQEYMRYFQQPQEEKRKYLADTLPQSKHSEGGALREAFHEYNHPDVDGEEESARHKRETLLFYAWPDAIRSEELWPESIRNDLSVFSSKLQELDATMLALLAESLGIPSTSFQDAMHNAEMKVVIAQYYPTLPQEDIPKEKLGLTEHLDTTILTTLVCSDVVGLQVEENGQWIDVEPQQGALVVQPGVLLQVLSNDQFKAKLHRVKTPSVPRCSIVAATWIGSAAKIEPLSHLVGSQTPAIFTPFHVGDYFIRISSKESGYGDTLDSFRVEQS